MRVAASGGAIKETSRPVINRSNSGDQFMKRKSFLAIAILIGAGLWIVWPKSQTGAAAGAPGSLTFSKDIAPIIMDKCASCHHPGAVAPFSLLSYQDVRKRAQQVAYITEQRIMPPWKADQGDYEFKGSRRLSGEQ